MLCFPVDDLPILEIQAVADPDYKVINADQHGNCRVSAAG